jgi:hypothetical protein
MEGQWAKWQETLEKQDMCTNALFGIQEITHADTVCVLN